MRPSRLRSKARSPVWVSRTLVCAVTENTQRVTVLPSLDLSGTSPSKLLEPSTSVPGLSHAHWATCSMSSVRCWPSASMVIMHPASGIRSFIYFKAVFSAAPFPSLCAWCSRNACGARPLHIPPKPSPLPSSTTITL